MNPFSIICQSCAVRLKVTRLSAIGQMLACPKCGEMVSVEPPPGWQPPQVSDSSDNSRRSTSDSVGGDFEDIESILSGSAPAMARPQAQPARSSKLGAAPPQRARGKQTQKRTAASPGTARPNPATQSPRAAKPQTADRQHPAAKRRAASAPAPLTPKAGNPAADAPILPTDQWTSDETKRRKRTVRTVVAALSVLLFSLVGAGIWYSLPAKESTVAQPNPANEGNVPADDADLQNPPQGDPGADEQAERPVDPESPLAALDAKAPIDGEQPAMEGMLDERNLDGPAENENQANNPNLLAGGFDDIAPTTPPPLVLPAGEGMSDEQPPALAGGPAPIAPPPLVVPQSPFGQGGLGQENLAPAGDEPKQPGSPLDLEPTPKRPGQQPAIDFDNEMTALLATQNTSLNELSDAAAVARSQPRVGLPKYMMIKSSDFRLDLERQLQLPVGGIEYTDTPLIRILRDLTAISGVPITLDARSILAARQEFNPTITVQINNKTLLETIDELVSPFGFSRTIDEAGGVIVGFDGGVEFNESTHPLEGLTDIDNAGKQRLLAMVQTFVEPEIWVLTESPAEVSLVEDGSAIAVRANWQAHSGITMLLEKLSSARRLITSPEDGDALATIQSRTSQAQATMAQASKLKFGSRSEIGGYFNRFCKQTGVTVLEQWPSLIASGWNPQTTMPGNIFEPTTGEALEEIAQSMDLSFTTLDDGTVELLSKPAALLQQDLEVYSVANLIAAGAKPSTLQPLIGQALGAQLQGVKVRFDYNSDCQCVVVLAPQTIQRQIEALLNKLGSP